MTMTKQRIRRLREKIQESRGRIMEKLPFFALLLMYLEFVAVEDIDKISVNSRGIYFSPAFLDKLYPKEVDYIFCHQVMHIITEQIRREESKASEDFHFACDIYINRELRHMGFKESSFPHLGYVFSEIPARKDIDIEGMTPEKICEELWYSLSVLEKRTKSKYQPDTDEYWSRKNNCRENGVVILAVDDMETRGKELVRSDIEKNSGNGEGEIPEEEWNRRTISAISLAGKLGGKSTGKIPGCVERKLVKKKKPKVDWRKVLNEVLQQEVCDYSFTPPDRRFSDTDFFLPDFNERDFTTEEILFMVDTSGSISERRLAEAYAEIGGVLEQFNGKIMGKLGFFDVEVTKPVPFASVEDLWKIKPYGGGGTDFEVIFEYVKKEMSNSLPKYIIIYTDGEAPFPDEKEATGIPVLWLLNNNRVEPPWGKVVYIPNSRKKKKITSAIT